MRKPHTRQQQRSATGNNAKPAALHPHESWDTQAQRLASIMYAPRLSVPGFNPVEGRAGGGAPAEAIAQTRTSIQSARLIRDAL